MRSRSLAHLPRDESFVIVAPATGGPVCRGLSLGVLVAAARRSATQVECGSEVRIEGKSAAGAREPRRCACLAGNPAIRCSHPDRRLCVPASQRVCQTTAASLFSFEAKEKRVSVAERLHRRKFPATRAVDETKGATVGERTAQRHRACCRHACTCVYILAAGTPCARISSRGAVDSMHRRAAFDNRTKIYHDQQRPAAPRSAPALSPHDAPRLSRVLRAVARVAVSRGARAACAARAVDAIAR